MQNQIQNVLQYLFFSQLGSLGVACSQEKHSSVPCNCVDGCCRTCHLQSDSCSKHMGTCKCCHWLRDCLGCSFSLWLSSLAASKGWVWAREGLLWPQGWSWGWSWGSWSFLHLPSQCITKTCSQAEGTAAVAPAPSCGAPRAQRMQKITQGILCVLQPQGPWLCWGQGFCLGQWHSESGVGVPVMVRAHHFCFLLCGPWVLSTALHIRKSDKREGPCSGECVSYSVSDRPVEKSGLDTGGIPLWGNNLEK